MTTTKSSRRKPEIVIRVYKTEGTRYFALEVNELSYGNHALRSIAVGKASFIAGALLDLIEAGILPKRTKVKMDIEKDPR